MTHNASRLTQLRTMKSLLAHPEKVRFGEACPCGCGKWLVTSTEFPEQVALKPRTYKKLMELQEQRRRMHA